MESLARSLPRGRLLAVDFAYLADPAPPELNPPVLSDGVPHLSAPRPRGSCDIYFATDVGRAVDLYGGQVASLPQFLQQHCPTLEQTRTISGFSPLLELYHNQHVWEVGLNGGGSRSGRE